MKRPLRVDYLDCTNSNLEWENCERSMQCNLMKEKKIKIEGQQEQQNLKMKIKICGKIVIANGVVIDNLTFLYEF